MTTTSEHEQGIRKPGRPRSAQAHKAIIDATLELLAEEGFQGLSIEEVAARAGRANDRGYDCLVLEDCCGSYFPEFHAMGLKMIKAQGGIFGWVGSSESVIKALADWKSAQ